jgi:hypothetical protein
MSGRGTRDTGRGTNVETQDAEHGTRDTGHETKNRDVGHVTTDYDGY